MENSQMDREKTKCALSPLPQIVSLVCAHHSPSPQGGLI